MAQRVPAKVTFTVDVELVEPKKHVEIVLVDCPKTATLIDIFKKCEDAVTTKLNKKFKFDASNQQTYFEWCDYKYNRNQFDYKTLEKVMSDIQSLGEYPDPTKKDANLYVAGELEGY